MDKVAARATDLSRRIYASLPWGYRVAGLFLKLAYGAQETFGRFVYAKFIQAGVAGMPDINGQPALSLRDKVQGPRADAKLPSGYGRKFGEKAWAVCLKKLKSPELVEEAVAAVTMKLVSGQMRIQEGVDLQKAEAFVMVALINAGTDALRRLKARPNEYVDLVDDESGASLDITDPNAFKRIEDVFGPSDLRKIMQDVSRVNERAPSWIEAQLEGLSNVELAEQWGVSPAYVTKWTGQYLDKIKDVVYKHLRDAA